MADKLESDKPFPDQSERGGKPRPAPTGNGSVVKEEIVSRLTKVGHNKEEEIVAQETGYRLARRHGLLHDLECLERHFEVHLALERETTPSAADDGGEVAPPSASSGKSLSAPALRAYRLAVTDLFVERALILLERQATRYRWSGQCAQVGAFTVVSAAAIVAYLKLDPPANPPAVLEWPYLVASFTHRLFFFSLVVLAVVGLWRYGKAMLDQAERMLERRHAVRQGWLFVHLHDGDVNIDQLDKAFNWNVSRRNAFSDMRTNAEGPWTEVINVLTSSLPDLLLAGIRAGAASGDDGGDGRGSSGRGSRASSKR